jgi:aminopeptidase N
MRISFPAILFILFLLLPFASMAQFTKAGTTFSHADSLRGGLTPLRSDYDVKYYHLDVKFDIARKFISGSNQFRFRAVHDLSRLQFDLFANLQVDRILYKGKQLPFQREDNAVFITFPEIIKEGSLGEFTVYYSGNPIVAKHAPWDGGVVFSADSLGRPFVATACEGIGASIWWPNKDHLSDEVDSMLISISVPNGLKDVSNGRLQKITDLKNGYTRFDWFVSSPINNYSIAANIGNYTHFDDSYTGEGGKLSLDYWVLSYHRKRAELQFKGNVKPMLASYEHWLGAYPFYKDGYKLVETPYPAMEHQSAISYGGFAKSGPPNELRGVEGGKNWDFIILHESAHEWFGNNITAKDLGDLWIHEAFATYLASLFVESQYGKQAGIAFLIPGRAGISNEVPVAGPYNVNKMGSGDMYSKGAVLLNMIRIIVDDDKKWRGILRGLNQEFYHQTVTYDDVVDYMAKQSGKNLRPVFDQYLNCRTLPVLEFVTKDGKLNCRWIAEAKDFSMPVRIRKKGAEFEMISPSTKFAPIAIEGLTKDNVEVDLINYYIGILLS